MVLSCVICVFLLIRFTSERSTDLGSPSSTEVTDYLESGRDPLKRVRQDLDLLSVQDSWFLMSSSAALTKVSLENRTDHWDVRR